MKKTTKDKSASYKFHLDMCGIVSESEGETPLEAFNKLTPPAKFINKAVLVITQGDKRQEFSLTVPRLKRLFYPNFRAVILKQLMYGF